MERLWKKNPEILSIRYSVRCLYTFSHLFLLALWSKYYYHLYSAGEKYRLSKVKQPILQLTLEFINLLLGSILLSLYPLRVVSDFIYSFTEDVLSAYHMVSTILGGGDTVVNKTNFWLYDGAYILVGRPR